MAFIDNILSEYEIPSPSDEEEISPFRLNGKIKTIRYHEDRWEKNIITVYHLNQQKKVIKKERIWTTGGKSITRIFYNEKDEFIKEELELNDGSKFLIKELIYSDDNLPHIIKRYNPKKSIRMTYNDLKQVIKQEIIDEDNEDNEDNEFLILNMT